MDKIVTMLVWSMGLAQEARDSGGKVCEDCNP